MFRALIVHLQERSYAVCCNLVCLLWGRRKNCSSSFALITTGRIETYQTATYSKRTPLKMDFWSPKHVELLSVTNKINHQILCILLDYGYIAGYFNWRTVCLRPWDDNFDPAQGKDSSLWHNIIHTGSGVNLAFHHGGKHQTQWRLTIWYSRELGGQLQLQPYCSTSWDFRRDWEIFIVPLSKIVSSQNVMT